MGLFKAAGGAISSTLRDQWKEAIRCEDMSDDILMIKKTTPTGVISNGSTIIVGPSQCAIIYDNGRIVDASAEEGVYTFDTSSTPSLFAGQFGGMFKEMWQRFTYNGATAKEQAVYFFNLKEIMNNKFGTPNPVIYTDWGHPVPNPRTQSMIGMRVGIRCFGKYTFKISDPFAFMSSVAGLADVYKKDKLVEQLRSEVTGAFSNVMNGLGGEKKIPAMDLPNKTDEIKQIMDEEVFDEPLRRRGVSLISFVVENVSFDEKSSEKIDTYELGGDSYTQQGTLVNAYSNAVQDAAKNSNGSMNGFMGVGMMNMASNGMMGGAAQGPWQQANGMQEQYAQYNQNQKAQDQQNQQSQEQQDQVQQVAQVQEEKKVEEENVVSTSVNNEWECPNCHSKADGKFCPECGTKKPESTKRFCSNCGNEVKEGAKFCPECGNKM